MHERDAPIKSARTTFEVIETLVELGGCSVTEFADVLDMPKSTVYEYLRTLKEEGYLINDDGTYRVSTRLLSIGSQVRQNYPVYTVAKPELRSLSTDLDEHASLMIEEAGYGVIIYTSPATHTEKIVAHTGRRTMLHATAPGKTILAHLPDERRTAILDDHGIDALTDHTITDRDALDEELDAIRDAGYATDREEGMQGILGVAVPILNRNDGSVEGAMSVYGPGGGDDIDAFVDEVLDKLHRTANIVEVNITYS